MTREEAIKHGEEQLEIFGGEHREFIELAIKSLEAWGKVREEIKYHADNIKYTDAYRDGFEVSLKIIDKHLAEVEE